MEKVIYKYKIEDSRAALPVGAKILSIQLQNESLCLWAEIDPKAKFEIRKFVILGTGHPIPDDVTLSYLATIQLYNYVWHIYEKNTSL